MSVKRNIFGKRGEELAARHLERLGYTLLHRNYRTRAGEIDIIAKDDQAIVFVEVKARTSTKFGDPAGAVTRRKQAQISRVAEEFLVRENLYDNQARFDVVTVFAPERQQPTIEVIRNAFELCR